MGLAFEPIGRRRLDFRPDRGAQAQKEGHRRQSRHGVRRFGGQIAVEETVSGGAESTLLQIHQQEGEIIEHVPAGDGFGKLDRVEQGRLAVDQRDVAKMQVPVTAADESGRAARQQNRPRDGEGKARILGEAASVRRREHVRPFGECGIVLLDIGFELVRRPHGVAQGGSRVRTADPQRELVDDGVRNALPLGDPVERRRLVEPAHVHDPFDDFARTPDRERRAVANDRQRLEIDARRVVAIDGDLGFASRPPPVERREIHERKPDRPLDLIDVGAGKKHYRVGGVRAPDPAAQPVRARVGEEAEHRLLQVGRLRHSTPSTISRPARRRRCPRAPLYRPLPFLAMLQPSGYKRWPPRV